MIVISLALVCSSVNAAPAQLFYLPFKYETYSPVSIGDIENSARCVFSMEVAEDVYKNILLNIQNRTTGRFDRGLVRLKIKNIDSIVYVDATGGILLDSGESFKMAEKSFVNVEKILEDLISPKYCRLH